MCSLGECRNDVKKTNRTAQNEFAVRNPVGRGTKATAEADTIK